MAEHDYEAGLRDGKIQAMERMLGVHEDRLDGQDRRLRSIEKVIYALAGAYALLQFTPTLLKVLGVLGNGQ